jgi:hypothetical protein
VLGEEPMDADPLLVLCMVSIIIVSLLRILDNVHMSIEFRRRLGAALYYACICSRIGQPRLSNL